MSASPSADPARSAARRVVIADDEALIRMDLKEMLQEEGYDVVGEAADGEEACRLAQELRLGRQVLHASAVRGPAGVIAFCGDSGTGKSTLAYAASRRGYRLWADDAVAFDVTGDDVVALPLPFRIILRPESSAYFGADSDTDVRSATAAEPDPLAAVVILERSEDRGVSVARLSGADAFAATLAQGYCYRPTDAEQNARMVDDYLGLAARVPVLAARFEPRFESVELLLDAIENVLEDGE